MFSGSALLPLKHVYLYCAARPCARCVKKGCPDECHDGARKKAKYLQEVPDECTSLSDCRNLAVEIIG